MFIDEATIRVQGGRGGNGVIRFLSNRHNWRGGPDGGNGGPGGSVLIRACAELATLYPYRKQPQFRAGAGGDGGRNNRQGARGEDRVLLVPVGTKVSDARSGELLTDLAFPGAEVVVARGGRGGRGNKSFTTSVRQAPRICERGEKGEERTLRLELQLLADVGIIGYPNVGKSSLISSISGKRAKVADYPFTTIAPNLGVVDVDGVHQFVTVDIPGLIEGAHTGKGLGDKFLRHVERTRVLIHMIDLAHLEGRDPLRDYLRINEELTAFDPQLGVRPQVVVGNKVDLCDESEVEKERARFLDHGIDLIPISVATGQGVRETIMRTYRLLQETLVSKEELKKAHVKRRVYHYVAQDGFWVEREGDLFVVKGDPVERLVNRLVLDSNDARAYLGERLERMGVLRELGKHGFKKGDAVRIGGVELELGG